MLEYPVAVAQPLSSHIAHRRQRLARDKRLDHPTRVAYALPCRIQRLDNTPLMVAVRGVDGLESIRARASAYRIEPPSTHLRRAVSRDVVLGRAVGV